MSQISRTDSFSIPEVDFLSSDLANVSLVQEFQVSEFKLKELAGELRPEPLLLENSKRFVLFPIKYPEVCHSTNNYF